MDIHDGPFETTYMIRNGGILKVEYLKTNGMWLVILDSGIRHVSNAGTLDSAIHSARKVYRGLK